MSKVATDCLKRKRTVPFSALETNFLKEIVLQHKNVIENKNSDVSSLKNKNEAWLKIVEEFNCIPHHTQRSEKQLRKCWDNLKTKRKKEIQQAKTAAMATGGGPPVFNIPNDAIDVFQDAFGTEIDGVIDSVDAFKGDEATNKYVFDPSSQKSEQEVEVETTNPDTDVCETPDEVKTSNLPLYFASVTSTATPNLPCHLIKGAKGRVRRKVTARIKMVEQLIEQDKEISKYLIVEAKFKAMAAKVAYKERLARLKKAEIELKMKETELARLMGQKM